MKYVNDSKQSSKHEAFELPLVPHMGHLDPNMKYLIYTSGTRISRTAMLSNWMPRHPVG